MKNFYSLSALFLLTGCLTQNPIIELAPEAPTSLTVSPASPSNDSTPTIKGLTSSSVGVVLFSAPGCTGSALAAGQAGNNGQFSLTSGELPTGQYNFSVRASSARGSICSTETVAYDLTATPPAVKVTKDPASPAMIKSTDTVNFIVEYTDAEEVNLTSNDILISNTGAVTCADITVTDGTTSTPHVEVGNCTGDGTFGIVIKEGTATNLAGSSSSSNLSGIVTVDNTGISAATFDPAEGTYTTMPSSIVITFPEAFSGLDVSDFTVTGSCSIKPNISIPETTSLTATIALTAPTCAASENVIITLDFTGVEDGAGNPGTGQMVATYTIDSVGPTSATFSPAQGNINAIPAFIDVTFNEDVNSSTISDETFKVTGNCTELPTVKFDQVTGATARVLLTDGACTNTQSFNIEINLATVEDSMNTPGSGSADVTYTFDDVGPEATSFTDTTRNVAAVPTSVTVNFDEIVDVDSVSGTDLQFSGSCSTGVTASLTTDTSGTSMSFDLLGVSCSHGETLTVTLDGSTVTDLAGNAGTGTPTLTYTVDTTGPSVMAVSPDNGPVNGLPGSVTFTFSEDIEASSVSDEDFTLAGSCSQYPEVTIAGVSGADVTVNLANASCAEGTTVVLTIESSGITDTLNNAGTVNHSVTFTQDGVAPTVQSFALDTGVSPVVGTLTFNEDIKGPVDLSHFDVTLNSCTTGDLANFQTNGAVVTFELTTACDPTGEVTITLKDQSVEDLAGNKNSGTSSVTYTEP